MKLGTRRKASEKIVKDIKRVTRKQYSAEEKVRIALDGLRGEDGIAELCRREGISQGIYYKWSKDFIEAGKRRLAGDTARATTTDEAKDLRRESRDLKEVVARQTLEGWVFPEPRSIVGMIGIRRAESGAEGPLPKPKHVWNRILLENYFYPADLQNRIEAFVEHYNHQRYHESIQNLTPADVYFGRGQAILNQRTSR